MDRKDLPPEENSHPQPEILAAYSEDRLDEPELEAVREHLAACPECAAVMLDLLDGKEVALEEAPPFERERSWRELRGSLQTEGLLAAPAAAEKAAPPAAPVVPFRPAAAAAPYWRPLAVAASLAFALAAGWSVSLLRQLDEARELRVDPPLVSLMPLETLRTAVPDPPRRLALAPGKRGWLVLNHAEPAAPGRVRLRFLSGGARTVVWEQETRPADPRSVRLELSLDAVPAGSYEVELALFEDGERGGSWRTFATYRLEVAALPSG